jgi:SAM-dependent methyltransferase
VVDLSSAGYRHAGADESVAGNRHWWDASAHEYHAEHGAFLGRSRFVWGPEGLDEDDAGLLGEVDGLDALEVGAGSGSCSQWLASRGARAVASDLSAGMLAAGRPFGPVGAVQADARALPFADASFDLAFSAYGALPFVADPERVHAEVARVLRPGGRWVFSISHPIRWAFPDDPSERGLTARRSYWDDTPYVELDAQGRVIYAEHHRTLSERIAEITAAGLVLDRLVEPQGPAGHTQVWGGWSPLRGRLLPGTLVLAARLT